MGSGLEVHGKTATCGWLMIAGRIWRARVAAKKLQNPFEVVSGRAVLILLPLFYRRVADPEPQQFGKLRHGKVHVDALFPEVLPQGPR